MAVAEEVEIQVKQAMITPFWQKMPFFFLFPFRVGPLIMLGGITAASVVAGLALGGLGLLFKGSLVYLGLRYAFNVLDLFSQGKFDSESPDNSLMGHERRPAKFGLVVTLFLVIGINLGSAAVISRVASDARLQAQFVERYKADHAAEMAKAQAEIDAFNKRYSIDTGTRPAAPSETDTADDEPADAGGNLPGMAADPTPARAAAPEVNMAEILALYTPRIGDPQWFKLLPGWYWIVMILLSIMLPASVIVIAMEDKFFKSLNPAHVIFLGKSMGRAYAVLWAFFLLIAGTRLFALSAGAGLPMYIRFPIETALSTYLGIVLFAMIGYALYQYHQELGLDVAVDFDSHRDAGGTEGIARAGSTAAAIRQSQPEDPLERKVQALLGEGKTAEAIAEIKDYMRYDRFNPALNTRLHPLYVKQGDVAAIVAHGQQWVTALIRAQKASEAVVALQKLLAVAPDFMIEDGDALLPIAQSALDRREHALALKLIRGFDKRFPKHKDTAAIFFLGARLSSEYLRKHEDAIKILRTVLRAFPSDPIAEEARTYLSVLEKVVAQG